MGEAEKRQEEIAAAKNAQDDAQKAVVAEQVKEKESGGVKKAEKSAVERANANNGIAYSQKH